MKPKRLPEAAATIRQRIATVLRAGPATAKDLSRAVGISEHVPGASGSP
jgi:hypothetical protein